MSYIEYDGLTSPNEVLEKMADYIKRKGYTIIQDYTDDANIYDRSSNDGKKLVFQDRNNEYFIHLRSANGTNIFGTNDDAQMDVASPDIDAHYYGIGMTVSEGYSKAQRWYNQFNAPLKFRDKDVQAVYMPVTQGTSVTPVKRPEKVDYPAPVEQPVKPDYPKAPVKADYPTKPTKPTDPTVVRSNRNASLNRKIAPRITNIHGTDPFSLKQYDIDKYGGNGVPLADLFYDSSHQYNNDIVVLFDNNSMKIAPNGAGATIERGNGFKNEGMYVNGDGNYKDITYVFGEEISTLTEQTFMDKWNAMPEPWKEQFSVGSNFNFPFNIIEQKNTGDVNATAVWCSVGPLTQGFTNMIIGIAMPKSVFEKLKNFSQTISDYNTALEQYQTDLDAYNQQVAAIDAQYDSDLAKYQQQCNAIDTQYNSDVATYNKYLQDVEAYNNYLEAEENYINYLTQKNASGYVYNLYCNELTKPTATLAFSLVKQATQVVDTIADPPVRPTPPVKPVKAPYPNKPMFVGGGSAYLWKNIPFGNMSALNSEIAKFKSTVQSIDTTLDSYNAVMVRFYMTAPDNKTRLQVYHGNYSLKTGTFIEDKNVVVEDFGIPSTVTSFSYVGKSAYTGPNFTPAFRYKQKLNGFYNNYVTSDTYSELQDVTLSYVDSGTTHNVVYKGITEWEYSNISAMDSAYDNSIAKKFDAKDIEDYNTQCQQIDNTYNTAMTQYNKDMAQYQQDMTTYDTAFDAYISDLEKGIGITYKEDDSAKLYQCTHLIVGNLDKYDKWTGGIYFSGSATRYMMKTCWKVYEDTDESDQYILPVLSSGSYSNTFLRIDIDEAPSDKRGNIYWASSGTDNITGKKLSLPIRVKNQGGNGKIPHYQYLQSQERLDWGRNINTLNCITVNMPIYFSVIVDPDAMDLYSACGAANGIYFISTLNTQTSYTYEIHYPDSNILCETFPMGKRRGYYGFDGISIYQEDSPPLKPIPPKQPTMKKPQEVTKPAVVDKPQPVAKPKEPTAVEEPAVVELNDIDIPYVPINNDGSRPQGVSTSYINNIKQLKSDGDIFV